MPIAVIFIIEKFLSSKISQCLTGHVNINNVDNDNIKITNVILEHNLQGSWSVWAKVRGSCNK